MEDGRLLSAFADPFPEASPAYSISSDSAVFAFGHIPNHHLSAPDINHQIEVKPDPFDAGGEIGNIPIPDLVWASCTQLRCLPWLLC